MSLMTTTSSQLAHKAFRPCEYFAHMATSAIHVTFNAVVVAKLTYAASSWWGFTTVEDRQRLEAVIRRGIRSGLCAPDHVSTTKDLFTDTDDKLFNLILYSEHHVLQRILSERSDFNYNLRPRPHNLVLTAKSSSITDKDFITINNIKRHILMMLYDLASGYCYCLTFYILFLSHPSCVLIFPSHCSLSTWTKVVIDWLIDWILPLRNTYNFWYFWL